MSGTSEPERVLVDTNVLVYATLERDPRYGAARALFERALAGDIVAFVSVQNLSEMYPNLTGPKTQPADSPQAARAKIDAIRRIHYLEVLPITSETVAVALELCEKYGIRRQNYFDMQLAATMILNSIPTILTENTKDFAFVSEIRAESPFA